MRLVSAVVVAVVAASALLSVCHAWGPVSHYRFSCGAVHSAESTRACVANASHADLLRGSDMPDAFFFGSFLVGSSCTGVAALHNVVFAGHQLHQALAAAGDHGATAPDGFDAVSYALGFGSHVVADFAGFWPGQGYLGNGHLKEAGVYNWISLWNFMGMVDAYVIGNSSLSVSSLPTAPLPPAGNAFIANATAAFAASGAAPAGFPVLSTDAVTNCTSLWAEVTARSAQTSAAYSSHTVSNMLPFYDLFGATTFAEAAQHADAAASCAVEGVAAWVNAMVNDKASPEQAAADVMKLYQGMFAAGRCK